MSDPADSPAPRSEDAEGHQAPGEALNEPPRPETPMEDSRPAEEPAVPAPDEPTPPRQYPARADMPPAQPGTVALQPAQPQAAAAAPMSPHQMAQQAAYYQQRLDGPLPPTPRWHRPDSAPNQAVVLLAVAVALFGAWAAFHGDGVGIGLALTGIAMIAVPLAAGDRADLAPRLPGAVLVAALWSVAAIRDAGWVVFLCSAAAFVLTPLVLAPQRRFSGSAIVLAFGWLEGLAESVKWSKRGRRGKDGRSASTVRNLWAVLVTAVLLVVFGGLFAAADSTFADLIAQLLPEVTPFEVIVRTLLAVILFPLALVWIYTAVAKPGFDSDGTEEHRVVSRFELAVPLVALNLLFAAFIAVQLRVFLGGEAYVMQTTGLTFADYARGGFWQLVFVAILSLAVIAIAAWLAPKREKADRWTARLLLGTLCALSMVVIASALFRMYTYFETFGLTRMRVWVFTVEIWLAVLFALVAVCCWKLRATWLPSGVLASGALALLGLAAVNPDALIARYNIEHEHELDLSYLSTLSNDAVPEFASASLSEEDRACALNGPSSFYDEDREILAWNLGYERARDLRKRYDGDQCEYSTESYDYGATADPEPDETTDSDREPDETTNEDEDPADPPPAGYFNVEHCEELDLAEADRLLGPDAGDYGLTLSEANSDAFALDDVYGSGEGWLNCGYYGSGDVSVQASLHYFGYESVAWDYLVDGIDAYRIGGWTITDLDAGSTAVVLESDGQRHYLYYSIVGNLVLYADLFDAPADDEARLIAEDLTGQLHDRYIELA